MYFSASVDACWCGSFLNLFYMVGLGRIAGLLWVTLSDLTSSRDLYVQKDSFCHIGFYIKCHCQSSWGIYCRLGLSSDCWRRLFTVRGRLFFLKGLAIHPHLRRPRSESGDSHDGGERRKTPDLPNFDPRDPRMWHDRASHYVHMPGKWF